MSCPRFRVPALLAALLGSHTLSHAALDTVAFLELRVSLLRVSAAGMERLLERQIVLAPDLEPRPVRAPFGGSDEASLDLTATLLGPLDQEPYALALRCRVDAPGGPWHVSRRLDLREGTTHLMEVAPWGEARLLLAVEVERGQRPALRPEGRVGHPVRLALQVERLEADETIPLETNLLHTFVGESVGYAFERGTGDAREVLEVRFLPRALHDSLVELQVEVRGSLPGNPSRLILDRRQTLVLSRGADSAVSVTAGTPPRGYRFRVRPEF